MKKGIIFLLVLVIIIGAVVLFTSQKEERGENIIMPSTITMGTLQLSSTAFNANDRIPVRYTCDGENVRPELSFGGVPEGAVSLVLTMDDPDIPESVKKSRGIETFDHWVVFNMPADTRGISEAGGAPGVEGMHSAGGNGYIGPCPPDREHRYFFKLYALDALLDAKAGATKADILTLMEGHIIEQAELIGRYDRVR